MASGPLRQAFGAARRKCNQVDRASRLSGFFKLSVEERAALLRREAGLSADEVSALARGGLGVDQADHMVENVVGLYSLPLGVATNFQINGRDVLVPMAIEEPSVIAGASLAARLLQRAPTRLGRARGRKPRKGVSS